MTGLERLRLDKLLTIDELAREVGIDAKTIRRVENGKPVRVGSLKPLAKFFDVPASTLVLPAADVPQEPQESVA